MRKSIFYIIAVIAMVGIVSCSQSGNEASADQIEQAHIAGREAARHFVSKKWKDSLQLQEQLVEAGVKRAVYDSLPECRAAYDSAFISTIRTVRPEIATELEHYRNSNK